MRNHVKKSNAGIKLIDSEPRPVSLVNFEATSAAQEV
jgi:hypothetical protein